MGKTYPPEQKSTISNQTTGKATRELNERREQISLASKILLLPIYFYRYYISPLIGPRCRFYPSCSTYAVEAIKIHGAIKGGYLAFKRILRCNPLNEGGEDPVPAKACCKKCEKNH